MRTETSALVHDNNEKAKEKNVMIKKRRKVFHQNIAYTKSVAHSSINSHKN